jgi:hypothetical protein
MRRYEFQDPNDRSPNSPGVMASSTRILALFNQHQQDPKDKADNVSQRVRDWFQKECLHRGWSSVEWVGNESLLRKDFSSLMK